MEFNDIGDFSADTLRNAVLKAREKKKGDSPTERLTRKTFPANFGILEWVSRGELRKAVEHYNNGGLYDWGQNVSWPREYWLMRIYDVMEELGRKDFEKFVPGLWDVLLITYRKTFSSKLELPSE